MYEWIIVVRGDETAAIAMMRSILPGAQVISSRPGAMGTDTILRFKTALSRISADTLIRDRFHTDPALLWFKDLNY